MLVEPRPQFVGKHVYFHGHHGTGWRTYRRAARNAQWESAQPMWAYAEAPAGTEYAIMRYRQRNSNLRTQLLRIIDRAGMTFWTKLFHNLRATSGGTGVRDVLMLSCGLRVI